MRNNYFSNVSFPHNFKKFIFLLNGFLFYSINSFAQVSTYCFTQSSGTYSAISGGTSHSATDDAVYTGVAIGFTFNFNGTNYTTCAISTNGFITFGGTNPAAAYYTPISGTTAYSGAIAAFARDLCPGTSPTLRSQTIGATPNRTFVIQWDNWKRYSGSCLADNIDCQIILYETSNNIDIVYGVSTAASTSVTLQVGLRGTSNADYNNRTTTTNWATTTAGGTNGATCTTTNAIIPASGLTFTYSPRPSAPGTTPGSRCGTGTVALGASGAGAGEDYKWYDALTGGTLLQTGGASYTTPSISATTTYYVTNYNTNTLCESTPRTAVSATISSIPAQPAAFTSAPTPLCANSTGNVYTVPVVAGATGYTWTLPAGASITAGGSTNSITTTMGAASGNVSVTADNGCGSSSARTVAITVNASPTVPTATDNYRCDAGTLVLTASGAGAGEGYRWYSALTGGSLLFTGNPYTTPSLSTTTTYYVVKYQTGGAGCESGPRVPVNANIYTASGLDAYTITRTTGITYTAINATGTAVTSWRNGTSYDNLSNSLPVGFSFSYDGAVNTQFRVSTNGFITFNTATNATGDYLPSCGNVNAYSYDNSDFTTSGKSGTLNAIAPFYNSIEPNNFSLNTSVHYQLTGSAPNRVLTVQWRGMSESENSSCSPCSYSDRNFQVKLFETSNNIEFWYSTMTTGGDITDNTYTSGLNSSSLSASPTITQLITQQTANTATFNNTVQNSLTTAPTTNSKITFTRTTPIAASAVPLCIAYNYPLNGATNQCLNSTLSWTASDGVPTSYDVYFGTNNPPTNIVNGANQTNNYYNPGTLATNTTYYWKIVPRNSFGPASGVSTYSFSTGNGDIAPSSISSSAGTTVCVGTTSTLSIVGGNLSEGSVFNWTAPFIFDFGCKINPPYPLLGNCAVNSFNYTFNSTGTYKWYAFTRGCDGVSSCVSITITVIANNNSAPTGITASPTSPICAGSSTTLTATGGTLGAGASTEWFTGSCGGTLIGTSATNSYTVSPAVTTQYWVRRTGGSGSCPNTTTCTSITITVQSAISNTITTAPPTICMGAIPAILNGSAPTGGAGAGTYTYLWESSTTSAVAGFAAANGTNNTQNYTPSLALGVDTWYRRTVSSGSCNGANSSVSAAIKVTVSSPSPGVTPASGDWLWTGGGSTAWETPSNWAIYNGSTYTIATTLPTRYNNVSIQQTNVGQCILNQPFINSTNTNLNDSTPTTGTAACKNISINAGSTLTATSTVNRMLYVAGNWVNNGTFTSNIGSVNFINNSNNTISGSSSTAFYNISVNKGSAISTTLETTGPMSMSASGELVLTNGLLKITHASSSVYHRTTGGAGLTIPSSAGLEINGGTLNAYNGTITNQGLFRVNSGTANVGTSSGNSLNNSSSSSFTFNGGTLNVAARLTFSGGSSTISSGTINLCMIANASITSSFDMSSGTNTNISGGTVIFQNANSSTGYDLKIASGGTKTISGGTFQFGNASTPASQIFKIDCPVNVYNVTINNTNTPTAQLVNNNLTITNNLTLNGGMLDLNEKTCTITNTALGAVTQSGSGQVKSESQTGYGVLYRDINANTGSNYIFPMGDGSNYIPLTMNLNSGNIGRAGVATYRCSNPSINSNWPGVSGIEPVTFINNSNTGNIIRRFWHLYTNQAPGYSVNITFKFHSDDDPTASISAGDSIYMQRYDKPAPDKWSDPPVYYTAPYSTSYSYSGAAPAIRTVAVNNINSFSWWGGTIKNTPLPINLGHFTTLCVDGKAQILWTTVSEINNDYFSIEKSRDLVNWDLVNKIKGAGNSTVTKYYNYVDEFITDKTVYYRLCQTDLDGNTKCYNPEKFNCTEKNSEFNLINILPNPTSSETTIYFSNGTDEQVYLTVYDPIGKLVCERKIDSRKGLNVYTVDMQNYSNGIYLIQIRNEKKSFSEKLIKQ